MLSDEILEKYSEKLQILADARGETVDQLSQQNWDRKKLKRIPKKFPAFRTGPIGVNFIDAGVEENLPFVVAENGRKFFGLFPRGVHARAFEYLKDLMSPKLTKETSLVAMDVASRYCRDWSWYPEAVLPSKGGAVVEVGAYLGHKSIRYVDECISEAGKFLAVEIMPENVEIYKKNIQVNNLSETMQVVHSGAWFEKGTMDVHGGGTVRNSLVPFSEESKEFEKQAVPVDSLDNILESWEPDRGIDFLDIRVNGAEYEALQGLDKQLSRVKYAEYELVFTNDIFS